jgi:hypothetical protein
MSSKIELRLLDRHNVALALRCNGRYCNFKADDFVLIRAGEILQEPLARSLVDKRGKRRPLRAPPGVQPIENGP